MGVTFVVSGMVDYTITEKQSAPLSWVFKEVGLKWATYIINVVRCRRVPNTYPLQFPPPLPALVAFFVYLCLRLSVMCARARARACACASVCVLS